jgi:hypothetical protein
MLISRQIRTEVSIIVAILKNENAKNLVALSLLSPKTVAAEKRTKKLAHSKNIASAKLI